MTFRVAVLVAASMVPLMAQQQGTGYLTVKAHPGRAGVFLDGKYLGPAANFRVARTYTVAAGKHDLKLVDPRFEPIAQEVSVAPGKKTKVNQTLKALPTPKGPFGNVRTQSTDKFAAVYVNGQYFGHADEFSNGSQGILLNPGEYEVKIEPASGQPVTKKVSVEAGKTVIVK